jgi:hypothetical protein
MRANKTIKRSQIALIGTEGSGKTVFVTCLAKYLEGAGKNGRTLVPNSLPTCTYTEKNFRILRSGEWPMETNLWNTFDLNWSLQVRGNQPTPHETFDLRIIDAAGHDLRNFFAKEAIKEINGLPAELRPLAEYCTEADVVLILANLADYMTSDVDHGSSSQWALKYALDHKFASNPDAKCALVFTQSDRYHNISETFDNNWQQITQHYIPHVYSAYIATDQIPVFNVSAVNKTRAVPAHGESSRMVPAADFQQEGFDPLIDWITGSVARSQTKIQITELETELHTVTHQTREIEQKIVASNKEAQEEARQVSTKVTVALSLILFFILRSIFSYESSDQVRIPNPERWFPWSSKPEYIWQTVIVVNHNWSPILTWWGAASVGIFLFFLIIFLALKRPANEPRAKELAALHQRILTLRSKINELSSFGI